MLSTILASVTIILVPIGGMLGNSGLKCGTYGGVYDIPTDTIYLCQEVEGDEEFYKYHEIGHHVWFKVLTQAQRDAYTKMHTRDLKKGKFFRDYSKVSVIEDFADNFAIVATKTNHNNTRLAFIRKLIRP